MAAKKANGKSTSTARVVDGKLILSYPDAINPVVWQMDLVQAKASAMEVRENAKGIFVLMLKTAKSEATEIAPFATKSEAVDALMAASRALENAQGQIRPMGIVSNNDMPATHPVKTASSSKWAAAALAFVMIVVLIGFWGSLTPRSPVSVDGSPTGAALNTSGDDNGVPLNADEFLRTHKTP